MQDFSKACLEKNMEFEVNGVKNFGQSLQKLRSLRSQLHHGANYCEASFMNAKEKKVVVDNTKEYICKAMITVVDHLGCVSDNLNSLIYENKAFSDAELQINILKQTTVLKLIRLRVKTVVKWAVHCCNWVLLSDEEERISPNEGTEIENFDLRPFPINRDPPQFIFISRFLSISPYSFILLKRLAAEAAKRLSLSPTPPAFMTLLDQQTIIRGFVCKIQTKATRSNRLRGNTRKW
ncbi:hypothetical protein UlMin_037634 [Ulmus minor]